MKLPSNKPKVIKKRRRTYKHKSILRIGIGKTFEYKSIDGSGSYKAKFCHINGDRILLKGAPFGRYVVKKDDLTVL